MFPEVGGKKKQYYCYNCKREITFQFRAKCTVCDNVELCCDCFSVGIKLNPHEPWHGYSINDCLEYPCFTKDWSYNEELLLLDAIEKCGLGNWRVITEYMAGTVVSTTGASKADKEALALAVLAGTGDGGHRVHTAKELKELTYNRTAKEIESHYYDVYIRGGYVNSGEGEKEETGSSSSDSDSSSSSSSGGGSGSRASPSMAQCCCYLPEKVCLTAVGAAATTSTMIKTADLPLPLYSIPSGSAADPSLPLPAHCDPSLCTGNTCLCVIRSDPTRPSFPATSVTHPTHILNHPSTTTDVMKDNSSINRDTLLPGYMPLRCDFDYEYENEAEMLLSDMDFASDIRISVCDGNTNNSSSKKMRNNSGAAGSATGGYEFISAHEHPSEIQLKLQVIDIFNQKLTQREARKKFVVETGLVDIKKQQQLERKAQAGVGAATATSASTAAESAQETDASARQQALVDERELVAKLRVFSRFSHKYNKTAGVDAADASSNEGGDNGDGEESASPPTSHAMLVDSLLKIRKLKRQIDVLNYYRRYHVTSLDDIKLTELEKRRKSLKETGCDFSAVNADGASSGVGVKRTSSSASLSSSASFGSKKGSRSPANLPPIPPEEATTATTSSNKRVRGSNSSNSSNSISSGTCADAQTPSSSKSNKATVPIPVHIAKDPCFSHLSTEEQQLCGAVNVLPSQYLSLQKAFVKEATDSGVFAFGSGGRSVQRVLAALPPSSQKILTDFLVQNEK